MQLRKSRGNESSNDFWVFSQMASFSRKQLATAWPSNTSHRFGPGKAGLSDALCVLQGLKPMSNLYLASFYLIAGISYLQPCRLASFPTSALGLDCL